MCAEYGRVEIAESDDNQVRVQIRMEGLGEGSENPSAAAKQVIKETALHTFINDFGGRLMIRIWHSTLGFTAPGAQPAFVSVRLQVPSRSSYRVLTEAFHGNVSIHRLRLSSATLRGNVGDKLKGIPGFIGQTELDNVVLAGDVSIDNLGGIPGVRAPVPPQMSSIAAPILVKAHVASLSQLTAVTGGTINIAIQPSPELGVRALGQANEGQVNVRIDGATTENAPNDSSFRTQRSATTSGLESRKVRVATRAASVHGTVNIASMPAAPLVSRRPEP